MLQGVTLQQHNRLVHAASVPIWFEELREPTTCAVADAKFEQLFRLCMSHTWWLPPEAGMAGVKAPGTAVALGAAGTEGVKLGCGIVGACSSRAHEGLTS